jgi:hypothetical protein
MASTQPSLDIQPTPLPYHEDRDQYRTHTTPNIFDSSSLASPRPRRPSNQVISSSHDDIQLNTFSSSSSGIPRPSGSQSNPSRKSLAEEAERSSFPLPLPAALQEGSQQHELKPIDRGRTANLFLFAALVAELTVWGLPFSVGILHEYWTNTLFKDQGGESLLTLAATLQVSSSLNFLDRDETVGELAGLFRAFLCALV